MNAIQLSLVYYYTAYVNDELARRLRLVAELRVEGDTADEGGAEGEVVPERRLVAEVWAAITDLTSRSRTEQDTGQWDLGRGSRRSLTDSRGGTHLDRRSNDLCFKPNIEVNKITFFDLLTVIFISCHIFYILFYIHLSFLNWIPASFRSKLEKTH